MMNQVILVGRLVKNAEILENEEGKKYCNITLAVTRNYKNAEGMYETDFVDCVLYNSIAESAAEYCRKGDVIGVKGMLRTSFIVNSDESESKITEIVAEKVTFLSSKKVDE